MQKIGQGRFSSELVSKRSTTCFHLSHELMPVYRVTVHGRNFLINLDGKSEKYGFYTTRFAEASDEVRAEHVALEDFRQSTKYLNLIEASLNSEVDPPVLAGEEIEEVPPTARDTLAGLALYRESGS